MLERIFIFGINRIGKLLTDVSKVIVKLVRNFLIIRIDYISDYKMFWESRFVDLSV